MEKKNRMGDFCHAVTYEAAKRPAVGKSYKSSWDDSDNLADPLASFVPTPKSSGPGRSKGISYRQQSKVIEHRMSVDCVMQALDESPFEKLRRMTFSHPQVLHIDTHLERSRQHLSGSYKSLNEEDKEAGTKEFRENTKSTTAETPIQHESQLILPIQSFESKTGKAEDDESHSQTPLQKSKSPNPLQSKKWKITIPSSVCDGPSPFHHLFASGRPSPSSMEAYKEFLYTLYGSLLVIKQIDPSERTKTPKLKMSLTQPPNLPSNKTVVLDLDETLVHEVGNGEEADESIDISFPNGETVTAAVSLRPGLKPFLAQLHSSYEVVVFTSSDRSYADAILNRIDPDRTLIHHRLYREHCVKHCKDFYIKDLRVLGRDLKNVIIVDNAPYAFAYQLDNGYPIMPYLNDKADQELEILGKYLETIRDAADVRDVIRERFKLSLLCELNIEQYAKYYKAPAGTDPPPPGIQQEVLSLQQAFNEFFK